MVSPETALNIDHLIAGLHQSFAKFWNICITSKFRNGHKLSHGFI